MFRKIALFCALIGLVAFVASSAYAEVQNIKVSGDITAMGVYRNNYDLEDGKVIFGTIPQIDEYFAEDTNSLFMSIVRLRVDADLTDNVSAAVRLANVREWDVAYESTDSIQLDLAYITLKEMLYSPLTLIIGRQELMYGTGLIVGPGLYHNPGGVKYNDLSPLHGFDAVRAILDYDPWTIDLVLAKMYENDDDLTVTGGIDVTDDRDSDTDLYGVNVGYKFDRYDAEMEGYIFYNRDENYGLRVYGAGDNLAATFEENLVYTGGLRGSVVPADNLSLSAEVAGQWGEIFDVANNPTGDDLTRDRSAMLANVAGEYDFADVRFNPVVGVEYLYLSGEELGETGFDNLDTSDYDGWHPIYRGRSLGTIRDCLETLYTTNDVADMSGWTNQHTVKATGSLDLGELVDGLSLDLAFLHYWYDEEPVLGADDDIGNEVNMRVTYDYTEDVQFLLDGAWFMPGDYYDDVHANRTYGYGEITAEPTGMENEVTNRVANDTAVSIIGSCKVTF